MSQLAPGISNQGKIDAFAELMNVRGLGLPPSDEVVISGNDPYYRTPFRLGETVAASLAAIGVAANDIWQLRTGRRQKAEIDVRSAAATLRTVDSTLVRNSAGRYVPAPMPEVIAHMISVTRPYLAKDGCWVLPHFVLQHLANRVLGVLQCEMTRPSISAAVAKWSSDELEDAIANVRGCGGRIRTPQEWLEHAQGQYLSPRPVVEIRKIGESTPEAFHAGDRPLSGVRVLDLTRILAGPIGGRSLAEHGADVLMVTAEKLPQNPVHVRDTSHGKRSCFLDLTSEKEAAKFKELVGTADVLLNGYRPARLAALGFGLDEVTAIRPGLIYVSVSCFGSGGPFASRAGWEQIAQAVTGICHNNGLMCGDGKPKLVFVPLCDYLTGYLAAYGTMLALARRAHEGGSYDVQVSLCQSAMFVQRQGMVDSFADAQELTEAELNFLYIQSDTCYGDLKTIGPVLKMSETPCRWIFPTPKLGSSRPEWLARQL